MPVTSGSSLVLGWPLPLQRPVSTSLGRIRRRHSALCSRPHGLHRSQRPRPLPPAACPLIRLGTHAPPHVGSQHSLPVTSGSAHFSDRHPRPRTRRSRPFPWAPLPLPPLQAGHPFSSVSRCVLGPLPLLLPLPKPQFSVLLHEALPIRLHASSSLTILLPEPKDACPEGPWHS